LRERFQLFNHQVERARDERRLTPELHPVANIGHHHVLPAIELGLQLFRRDSRDLDPPQKPLPRDVDPPPHRLVPKGLKPERLELGGRQRDTWDGVNPAPRESLPRPFDLRNRDTGLPQEVGERVEPLAAGLAAPKPAVQWREGNPVLGLDRIDVPTDSHDMQKPHGRAAH
jgi:hypothetical protein